MRILVLGTALLALSAAAADARRGVPAATPIGEAIDCLPLSQFRETQVRDDRTIDFIGPGRNRVYRNILPYQCPSLGFERRFAYKTSLSRLCSVDTITVLYSAPLQRGATCGLGTFQPVQLAKR